MSLIEKIIEDEGDIPITYMGDNIMDMIASPADEGTLTYIITDYESNLLDLPYTFIFGSKILQDTTEYSIVMPLDFNIIRVGDVFDVEVFVLEDGVSKRAAELEEVDVLFEDDSIMFDIDPATGHIEFTPIAEHEGDHYITITALIEGEEYTTTFPLVIVNV